MVEPLWGTRASPLWSGLWPCSCVQQSLPLCGVNRVSPHGPVSTRQASLAVLIEPVGRRLLPYTPWRYCRSIRPKHWETCTRVGTTWRFYMSCVLRRTSHSERRRWPHSLWVVRCPRLWSRSAISGCVSLTWRSRRRYSSWMLPCHRPAFSATLSRAVPSSFRQHRSRLRRSSTSCAGGNPLLLPALTAPLEPLQSVELKFLSMKTLLLTALASIKRVGDLQAFSVDDSCLQFGPADSSATLRPRPGYVPKVPTTPFRDQVVNLQALPPEEADPALALLCPVRALRQYTDRTQSFRTSEQLFVCYGGQQKGRAVSKQRMAHWIVDAITLAYEAQGVPCPLRLRAHSTRGVASSWALARGASLADICRAAGWATPNTFARFYSLRVEPVSSCVLTSNG